MPSIHKGRCIGTTYVCMGPSSGWCGKQHTTLSAAVKCWRHWREIDWPARGARSVPDRRIIAFTGSSSALHVHPPLADWLIPRSGLLMWDGTGAPLRGLTRDEERQIPAGVCYA